MIEEKPESEWTVEDWRVERDALVVENEWFKAQWASVPWEAINSAFGNFFGEAWTDEGDPIDVIEKWLDAYAPKANSA